MSLVRKIRRFSNRMGRKVFGDPRLKSKTYPTHWFDKLLGNRSVQVVQIGSNSGMSGDPLHILFLKNKNWKGLFVEPVPYLFEQLKKNYPNDSRLKFENAAINDGAVAEFHWIDPLIKEKESGLPFYYDQLGSFKKEHISKVLGTQYEQYIISEKIAGLTLPNLFKKYKIEHCDLLHIDVEGYDWVVLSQFEKEKFQPTFIMYEGAHLSEADLQASFDFLSGNYQLHRHHGDILAVNRSVGTTILYQIGKSFELAEKPLKSAIK